MAPGKEIARRPPAHQRRLRLPVASARRGIINSPTELKGKGTVHAEVRRRLGCSGEDARPSTPQQPRKSSEVCQHEVPSSPCSLTLLGLSSRPVAHASPTRSFYPQRAFQETRGVGNRNCTRASRKVNCKKKKFQPISENTNKITCTPDREEV